MATLKHLFGVYSTGLAAWGLASWSMDIVKKWESAIPHGIYRYKQKCNEPKLERISRFRDICSPPLPTAGEDAFVTFDKIASSV